MGSCYAILWATVIPIDYRNVSLFSVNIHTFYAINIHIDIYISAYKHEYTYACARTQIQSENFDNKTVCEWQMIDD